MTGTISPSVPCSAAATAAVTRSWSASLTWLILVRAMLPSPYQPPDAPPPPKLPPPPEKPPKPPPPPPPQLPPPHDEPPPRSEERRVGKEGVRTCSSRWSP